MSLAERSKVIPGGVMTRSKALFGQWAHRGFGAEVWCQDGVRRLDMLCGLGAVSLGYAGGGEYDYDGVMSLPCVAEIEAAEAVLKHVAPWASHVRFTCTGSEACHAAYRIAKKTTGRDVILMGDYAYHGWHEFAAERGPLLGEGGYVEGVTNLQFKHGEQLWAPHPDRVAAVFVEPHRFEILPDGKAWLQSVRAFCDRIGALLVFDSMIWGGRHALGGLSQWSGVIPDLECFGKAFGNGEPVAFVVGRDALAKHGTIASGTYSGHPRAMQAVIDTIHTYTTDLVIHTLWARGRQLQEGLRRVVPARIGVCEGYPVHQRIRFFDDSHGPKFTAEMLKRGIIWHFACANVCFSHTEEQIDRVIAAAAESVMVL